MADSINSTTASAITRRSLLGATGVLPFAAQGRAAPSDPALALWHEWRANHRQVMRLTRAWQRLESVLVDSVGFPQIAARPASEEKDVIIQSAEDIEECFADAPQAEKARLLSALEEHIARWREATCAIGLDAVGAELDAAYDRRQDLMARTAGTSAASLSGVAAKLAMIIEAGERAPGDEESPWPELRLVLADLTRLGVPEAAVFPA
jgi:hypothetical protein